MISACAQNNTSTMTRSITGRHVPQQVCAPQFAIRDSVFGSFDISGQKDTHK
jgi:hypothetical protein